MNIKNLNEWYKKNKRSLPWRMTKDPYAIWISEIMLQQTTVMAVIPFYKRFLENFPKLEDLAKSKEEKVLSLWSGLGYYSRARNLQKAAKLIVEKKTFPNSYLKLLELPGVGPYTAAAVASIAFEEEVPAIDGNVIRVISRIFNINEDVNSKKGKEVISKRASELISGQHPSEHNQAMMELGATICLPKNPSCLICPVLNSCQAQKAGVALERPIKKKKRSQEPWLWELFLFQNKKGQIALVKDNGTPWVNHLWTLPGQASPWKKKTKPKAHFRHSITHHKIYVKLIQRQLTDRVLKKNIKWINPRQLEKFGVSSVVLKAFKHWDHI